MGNAANLRQLFEQQKTVAVPGAYDVYSALLAQKAGFPVVYLGGFSISASLAGYPDWGLITMSEMLAVARNAVDILDIPIICDIDQGFGALTNFTRTLHSYENAGVAAVHFEDQPFPKKCSQQKDRQIISREDAVTKIKAAVDTRTDPDFTLIARTDSKAVEGLDGLKRRMDAYLEAGADYCIFCEQETTDELIQVAEAFPGRVIAFVGDAADNPACCLPVSRYEEMGYKALFYCALGLCAAHHHVSKTYEQLQSSRQITSEFLKENLVTLKDVQETAKINEWQQLRDKYDML